MGPEIFAVSYSEVQKKLDKIGSYRVLQRLENVSQELIRETTKSGKTDKELARELARTRLLLSGASPQNVIDSSASSTQSVMSRLQGIVTELRDSGAISPAVAPPPAPSGIIGNPFGEDYGGSKKVGRQRKYDAVQELDLRVENQVRTLHSDYENLENRFEQLRKTSVRNWYAPLQLSGFFEFEYNRRKFQGQAFLTSQQDEDFCQSLRLDVNRDCKSVFVDLGRFDNSRMVLDLDAPIGQKLDFHSRVEFRPGDREFKVPEAYLDYFWKPNHAFRAGVMLVPFGNYNAFYDSPLRQLSHKPAFNEFIVPTVWFDAGIGLVGAGVFFSRPYQYQFLAMNGLSDSNATLADKVGIKGLKRDGIGDLETDNDDKAIAGHIGLDVSDGLRLGYSFYEADVGRYLEGLTSLAAPVYDGKRVLSMTGFDWERTFKNKIRWFGEYAVGDAGADPFDELVDPTKAEYQFEGWFTQVETPLPWLDDRYRGVVRIGEVDTHKLKDNEGDVTEQVIGVTYRPDKRTVYRIEHHTETLNANNPALEKDQNGLVFGVATAF
jgi:hypothetical protein